MTPEHRSTDSRVAVPISAEEARGSLAVGTTIEFSKTVGETDVYLFAGISGDFSPNHVNEQYMSETRYGRRIAHGALLVGYMSTCSTKLIESAGNKPMVSYGYDRIRFIKPVFLGDTVTVRYRIAALDEQKGRVESEITVTNQRGETVAVATHILKAV